MRPVPLKGAVPASGQARARVLHPLEQRDKWAYIPYAEKIKEATG